MAKFLKSDIMSLTGETARYDLAESIGPDLRLGTLLAAAGESDLDDLALAYGTAAGHPELRRIIAELNGVEPDDVVITVGGMQALFLAAFILCEKGDEAVTTTPLFPPARNALTVVGAEIRTLALSFDQGYRVEPEALAGQLSDRTKLVSLASPQNPSGVAIAPEDLRAIAGIMAKRCPEAFLLIDETYREAVYGDESPAESAAQLGDRVICCASLSKCHGAPGLRLGWAITRDSGLREQLVLGKFSTVLSCSAVDEALALEVLRQRERIIGERRRHLAEGLARTAAWVEAHEGLIDWIRPDAGALCCLRLDPRAFDDAAVDRVYAALAERGIRVGDGRWFGEESRVFRLGFGLLSMADLEAGLAGLSAAIKGAARAAA